MKRDRNQFEWVPVQSERESLPIDMARIAELITLIEEMAKLDVSDKEQQKKCISLLFRVSWLVSALPRPLKFNSESLISALGARNWVMLDYLSIALKKSQTHACPSWKESQYSGIVADLMQMKQYFKKYYRGDEIRNVDTEYEGLESVVGDQLNTHSMNLAHEAIQMALDFTGNQDQDDLTLFRVICIVGETAKIISPALRNKIIVIYGDDSKILTHLSNLRDLIIHDKFSSMQVLKSDRLLRDNIYKVVLPFLRSIFGSPNLDATQKQDCSEEAIATLAEFINKIKEYEGALKAKESNPPMPTHLNEFAKLLWWGVSFIEECRTLEEFIEMIIVKRSAVAIPEINLLSDDDIREFFLWKPHRLISFNTLKKIISNLDSVKGCASQAEKKNRLKDYFHKAEVTRQENDECTLIVGELSLLSESYRECLKQLIKGKQVGVKPEDKWEDRKDLICQELKLTGKNPYLDYLEYIDFINSKRYKDCVGKRNNSTSLIDQKLFLECFPQSFDLIKSILARGIDMAPETFLVLTIFTENFRILDQLLDDNEYQARVYHYISRQGFPPEKINGIYEEIKRVSQISGLEGTKEKLYLSRALSVCAKGNPPILMTTKDRKIISQLLDQMKFDGNVISSDEILGLRRSLDTKHIKDKEVLIKLTENLVGCDKETCLGVVEAAFIKSKVISQLESDIPWENRIKKVNTLYLELLSQVRFSDGKSAKDLYGDELLRLVRSDIKPSCQLVMEPLFVKCDTLADTFLAYHRERDPSKKSKLKLAAEYLVEDLGETAEALAAHLKFSDSELFEVSKRNLLIIAFVRKCIAHFPLGVNTEWFEYLMMLFSFNVPDRLNQYLKLSEDELWKRVFQSSRRVSISEFRENEEMHLNFQMMVEQCGYNPIVRILHAPVGIMGDLNVIVEANATKTASLWDTFELEIMLGHLINANVRVESRESFVARSKDRVLDEDLRELSSAELLPELVMKDTVRSLLRDGNFSALGGVGRSDLKRIESFFEILKIMTMDNEVTPKIILERLSDMDKIRDLITRFLSGIIEQSDWEGLKKWSELFFVQIVRPSLFGNKPVKIRMAKAEIEPPAYSFSGDLPDFSKLPETVDGEPDPKYKYCYLENPEGPCYERLDYIFFHFNTILMRYGIESLYVKDIIDASSKFLWSSRFAMIGLVTKIRNIESGTTVDHVRDQGYITEHYRMARDARKNRLDKREDVREVIRMQAYKVGEYLSKLINDLKTEVTPAELEEIRELLLIWVQNNIYLDTHYIEREYELTKEFQSMDDCEREAYGVMISLPRYFKDRLDEHHVTSKYAFRILGRLPGRSEFSRSFNASLKNEHDRIQLLSKNALPPFRKLQAVFNNLSQHSLVSALFNDASVEVVSRELEVLFEKQYYDKTELPLVLHYGDPPQSFEELYANVEHIAFLMRMAKVRELAHTVSKSDLVHIVGVFQGDLSVSDLNIDEQIGLNRKKPLQLPPIFNGIIGYASELDGVLSQLHIAIARRSIFRRPTSCFTRCDLVRSLFDHYNSRQEYLPLCHSTMAYYEWSTSTIDDLFKRYQWSDEEVKSYKMLPSFEEHERCILEYYEYQKIYSVIQSYQARAAKYTKKIKDINGVIMNLKVSVVEALENPKILYLQDQLDLYRLAYQSNRIETKIKIKTLFETNFVKRRMLKCMQLPVIMIPMIDEILAYPGNRNEFEAQKIAQLLSAIRNQVDREIREETQFSIEKERQFGGWLESHNEQLPSLQSPQAQGMGCYRYNFLPGPRASDVAVVPSGSMDYSEARSPPH